MIHASVASHTGRAQGAATFVLLQAGERSEAGSPPRGAAGCYASLPVADSDTFIGNKWISINSVPKVSTG